MASNPRQQAYRTWLRRLWNIVFLSFFVLYTGAAIVWLAAGLAPFLVGAFPSFREPLAQLAYPIDARELAGGMSNIAILASSTLSASYTYVEIEQVVLQYLFSLISLVLGIFLVYLRPHNLAARLLAIGLIGTAAIFNLHAHTATSVLPSLETVHSYLHLISGMAYVFGLLLFPSGRLPHGWTRARWFVWPARVVGLALLFYAGMTFNFSDGDPAGMVMLFGVVIPVAGTVAQAMRSRGAVSAEERQQSRVLMWALALAFGMAMAFGLILGGLNTLQPALPADGFWKLQELVFLVFPPLFAVIPITLFFVILRFRLWDIDRLLSRTVLYSTLTTALGAVYFGSIVLLQMLFGALTAVQSTLAVVASTLLIAGLFRPLRQRLQAFVDRRFYRETVNFRQAFLDFGREIRTIIDLSALVRVLVERTTSLLHISHGAVFLRDGSGAFRLEATSRTQQHAPVDAQAPVPSLSPNGTVLERLQAGVAVEQSLDAAFPLLVPLRVPRGNAYDLLGVLALGRKRSGQRYSQDDQALLLGLADQAGTAIHVAQLIAEEQAAAQRREEAERRLAAHRNSPAGRAEVLARSLIARPETALLEVHRLAQESGRDAEVASLLPNLPATLSALGGDRLASVAEGFNYVANSEAAPELLPVGLRLIGAYLESATFEGGDTAGAQSPATGAPEQLNARALLVYRLCEAAANAGSIGEITALFPPLQGRAPLTAAICRHDWTSRGQSTEAHARQEDFLDHLARSLAELQGIADTLHAVERVDAPEDKLMYLASAVEGLSRIARQAHGVLGAVDRAVVASVAERWLAIVSGAMSDLQTQARIVCELLTRRLWQSETLTLNLSLRNTGRAPALDLVLQVVSATEYAALDGASVARLAPGEEAQVEVHVRPRVEQGMGRFRLRCAVRFTDPRGPNQVEDCADVVELLATDGAFRFIPNPYVLGTPLQAGSPLFFGREDLMAFIEENLAAAHRNNLVLIGQRRTGKTSLLKQLPARLEDAYVPVYVDGQMLGVDAGLDNFFLALATEIAFALEDRGFDAPSPRPADFAGSPATAFERGFLPSVRGAIGDRHLLIMLDEFEELEAAVRRGSLPASIFGFVRHLIQHEPNLSVIFSGTHRLEELAADYWSPLFNISLYRHVGFLDRAEALRLVEEPVAQYGMRYDDLALEKIWRVTSGHPYFLQMFCHSLVNRHNKTGRSYMTANDANAALDDMLSMGEAHFLYLWNESSAAERLALAALSRMDSLAGRSSAAQVVDYLAERGVEADRRAIGEALHRLALRDILAAVDHGDGSTGTSYRWKLGLLSLWTEKQRPVSRAVEEVLA